MGVYDSNGSRVAKANLSTATASDPEVVVNQDLTVGVSFDPVNDTAPGGSLREVLVKSGATVRQSKIDSWYPTATVTSVSPATGTTAGGTVVTLTGTHLDGVTGVKFGTADATSVVVVSPTSVTCHAPAHTAGAVNVVVAYDGGTVTKTNAFTYA